MLSIDKNKIEELPFMKMIRKKCSNWQEFHEIYQAQYLALRKHLLENENTIHGTKYCTYCEAVLQNEQDANIEHIRPKSSSPHLVFAHTNLTISCNSSISCNNWKKGFWDEHFVHPVEMNPEEHIEYEADGLIKTTSPYARVTVDMLNLNNKKLQSFRRNTWKMAIQIINSNPGGLDYIDVLPTMIAYLKRNVDVLRNEV